MYVTSAEEKYYLAGRYASMANLTPTHEQEYIISLSELKRANVFMFTNKLKELSARPHTPAPKIPNSTELTQLAINDWHNREERKHRYELQPWVNGWITGFLTESKPYWSKVREAAIRKAEWDKVLSFLDELISDRVSDARKREIVESLRTPKEQP